MGWTQDSWKTTRFVLGRNNPAKVFWTKYCSVDSLRQNIGRTRNRRDYRTLWRKDFVNSNHRERNCVICCWDFTWMGRKSIYFLDCDEQQWIVNSFKVMRGRRPKRDEENVTLSGEERMVFVSKNWKVYHPTFTLICQCPLFFPYFCSGIGHVSLISQKNYKFLVLCLPVPLQSGKKCLLPSAKS